MTAAADSLRAPAGNLYDKYATTNPVARLLVSRFEAALSDLLNRAQPSTILDVGCGEGVLSDRFAARAGVESVVGADLEDAALRREWERRQRAGLEFRSIEPGPLPFRDGQFELVSAIEALEHVRDPRAMLAEMCRCASRWVIASVPREPLWRWLNLARGAYIRRAGNTPGHVNHWSRRRFLELTNAYGDIAAARAPLPWTMVLIRPSSL